MDDNLYEKGRIFDIQRFSLHDGPGIRTIVFFKGCKLRCKWCCNPESQKHDIQVMVKDDKSRVTTGRDVTVREILEIIEKDRNYYRRSGGGLTLSGGEYLCQPKFAKALLTEAKAKGINTAVETTSFADFSIIEELLPLIDNYLMDIKHINSAKHKEYTGVNNELILENAAKVAKMAKRMVIRVPVIPGFNDSVEEIRDIARFTESIGIKELNLLPYHRLGQDKYRYLGREYLLSDLLPPSSEYMENLRAAASEFVENVKIGG